MLGQMDSKFWPLESGHILKLSISKLFCKKTPVVSSLYHTRQWMMIHFKYLCRWKWIKSLGILRWYIKFLCNKKYLKRGSSPWGSETSSGVSNTLNGGSFGNCVPVMAMEWLSICCVQWCHGATLSQWWLSICCVQWWPGCDCVPVLLMQWLRPRGDNTMTASQRRSYSSYVALITGQWLCHSDGRPMTASQCWSLSDCVSWWRSYSNCGSLMALQWMCPNGSRAVSVQWWWPCRDWCHWGLRRSYGPMVSEQPLCPRNHWSVMSHSEPKSISRI